MELNKRVHMSDEAFEAVANISGLDTAKTYVFEWIIKEGNTTSGQIVAQDSVYFQPIGNSHFFTLEEYHFSTASHLYLLIGIIQEAGGNPSQSDSDTEPFVVFRNTVAPSWSNLVMFGDSLSDTKNSYADWGVPETPPYHLGRYSDGQVWLEKVHSWFGQTTMAGQGSDSGNNRAYGGAESGDGYYLWVITNLGQQVEDYTDVYNIGSNEATAIWIGGNDVRNGETDMDSIADNVETNAIRLKNDGASTILLFELPPMEKIPENNGLSLEENRATHELSVSFNAKLATKASILSNQGMDVHLIESWSAFEEIYWNPAAFGLVNVTHAACEHDGVLCDSDDPIVPNKHEYLFFDKVHPTLVTHNLISLYVKEAIGNSDYDGDGIVDDYDACNDTMPDAETGQDGCPPPPPDSDEDGVIDSEDDCPETNPNESVDDSGCAASQRDSDDDGVNDSTDNCPETDLGAEVDMNGCADNQADYDSDGIVNSQDQCLNTPPGEEVDEDGCSSSERDSDSDGIVDAQDHCPNSNSADVDENGCDAHQRDSDGDGEVDALDTCPGTLSDDVPILNGCGASQRDTDGDGVNDSEDHCEETPLNETVDAVGCGESQKDADYDGVMNSDDGCPELSGTNEGCPHIAVTLFLHKPMEGPGEALIRMVLSCEGGCELEVYLNNESLGNFINGQHLVKVEMNESGSVFIRAQVGSSFAESSLDITVPKSEPEEPEIQPVPTPFVPEDKEIDYLSYIPVATALFLLSAVLFLTVRKKGK